MWNGLLSIWKHIYEDDFWGSYQKHVSRLRKKKYRFLDGFWKIFNIPKVLTTHIAWIISLDYYYKTANSLLVQSSVLILLGFLTFFLCVCVCMLCGRVCTCHGARVEVWEQPQVFAFSFQPACYYDFASCFLCSSLDGPSAFWFSRLTSHGQKHFVGIADTCIFLQPALGFQLQTDSWQASAKLLSHLPSSCFGFELTIALLSPSNNHEAGILYSASKLY